MASLPATWWIPEYGDAASSSRAQARSVTCTGQRTSSVKRAPVTAPAASACTCLSCGESPSPMISEVRAMTAVGVKLISGAFVAAQPAAEDEHRHCDAVRRDQRGEQSDPARFAVVQQVGDWEEAHERERQH